MTSTDVSFDSFDDGPLLDPAQATTIAAGRGEDDAPVLSVRDLHKSYVRGSGQKVPAVAGVDIDLYAHEFLVLLGPSGCGKTTLLRCIAGLETPDSGSIVVDGKAVYDSSKRVDLPPQRRSLSMVFQSYALWPNMSVFDNVAYPLRNRGRKLGSKEIKEYVERVCTLVGVHEVTGQYPSQISGGQQQRVALARALVDESQLVLLDEPLSNVDAKVRKDLRIELKGLQAKFGFAAVYVTHDQEDAMELGDQIAVMQAGRAAQIAPPRDVYEAPASHYVATFVGQTNEAEGTVVSIDADGGVLDTDLGPVRGVRVEDGLKVGDKAVAIVRPELAQVHATDPGDGRNAHKVTYQTEMFSGSHTQYVLTKNHKVFRIWAHDRGSVFPPRSEVFLVVDPKDVSIFKP